MIIILDLDMNNQNSVYKVIKYKIGFSKVKISNKLEDIQKSEALILPGIGSFDNVMLQIKKLNLRSILEDQVLKKKKKIFGICVGMQIFFKNSEEGNEIGLEWLDGNIIKFKKSDLNKVPHIGWNKVSIKEKNLIFNNLDNENYFYFSHSYYANVSKNVLAETYYGLNFPSVINKENIYGCQFHPEKSHSMGKKILENFIKLI
jgi:glutamine amidotransferase